MIPATGKVATYRHAHPDGKHWWTHERIVAWDDDWQPLIAGRDGLRLAARLPDYAGIEDEEPAIVAAIPGGGWRVEYTDGDDVLSEPVVAWLARADGSLIAVDCDPSGITENVTETGNFSRLVPPVEHISGEAKVFSAPNYVSREKLVEQLKNAQQGPA